MVNPCKNCGKRHISIHCEEILPEVATNRPVELKGMGNTVPTYTNATGGKQSDIPYRFDLLPPLTLAKIAEVLKRGADKYGDNNWHAIPIRENLNHCLAHIIAYLAGDAQEDHLRNAVCRILFASEIDLMGGPKNHNPQNINHTEAGTVGFK